MSEKKLKERGSHSIPFMDEADSLHSTRETYRETHSPKVRSVTVNDSDTATVGQENKDISNTELVPVIGASNVNIIAENQKVVNEGNSTSALTEEPRVMSPLCPSGLHCLLDNSQMVVHMGNLRHNKVINEDSLNRMEIIDETRRILFYVEQDHPPDTDKSFSYKLYNKNCQEVIQVYNPLAETCVCCNASWHWVKRCKYQCVVFAPPGIIAGFVRRSQTFLVQEFEILSPQEDVLLVLRGGYSDLEIYTPDLEDGVGRLSVHGWRGIMHEVRRTSNDYGLTFPMDMDVRVKAVLIGSIFSIHWLFSTKGGRRR